MTNRHGVIIEFIQQGNFVKVSAVDTRTGIEGVIVGDPSVGEKKLEKLAIQKLEYVMGKQGKR